MHISAKQWRDRAYGNTYYCVAIYHEGELLVKLPFAYGYGSAYLYAALAWLIENKYLPKSAFELPIEEALASIKASHEVVSIQPKGEYLQ